MRRAGLRKRERQAEQEMMCRAHESRRDIADRLVVDRDVHAEEKCPHPERDDE